jgi:hypothetical protein
MPNLFLATVTMYYRDLSADVSVLMIGNSINDNLQMAVCETPNFKFYKFAIKNGVSCSAIFDPCVTVPSSSHLTKCWSEHDSEIKNLINIMPYEFLNEI